MSDNEDSDDGIISAEDVVTECEQLLSNDPHLTHIEFFYQDVTAEAIVRICEAMHRNFMVDWFMLEGCGLTLESAQAIGDMLRVNRRLRHLVLSENKSLGSAGIAAVMEGLCENKRVETIMLEDLSMETAAFEAIASMLKVNTTLKELSIGKNTIHDVGFANFSDALRINRTLVRLELGYTDIACHEVQYLFECIQDHPTLAHLDLTCNLLRPELAESFSDLLRQNKSLKVISVADNCLGPETVMSLAPALEENTTLQSLVMSSNGIGEAGALAFSRSLPYMKGLRDLYLVSNNMTRKGYEAIVAAMQANTSLHSVRLGGGSGPVVPHSLKGKMRFYERRNKIAQKTLEKASDGLWPHILGRLSKDPSMVYFFLAEAVGLVSNVATRGD